MVTNRVRSFLSVCFLSAVSGLFAADYPDGIAVNPLSPTDIPTDRKMVKLFSVNQSNLFTGEYLYEIPIDLPPAKGDLVPQAALKYNSGARHTSVGYGWDLEYSLISRSTRYGLPKYSSLTDGSSSQDILEYTLAGSSGELIFAGSTPYGYLYRPKVDGTFSKFYYRPGLEEWKIYETSGKVWLLGNVTLPGTNALDTDPDDPCKVYAWYVKRISDPDGNMIEYYYAAYEGQLRLTEIHYDLNGSNVPPKVCFEYDYTANLIGSPPDDQFYITDWPQVSYQKGYRTVYGEEGLSKIVVYGWDEKSPQNYMTREYTPTYKPIKKYAGPFMGKYIMGLANIVSFEPEASVAGKPMPKTEFYYFEPIRSFYEEYVIGDIRPSEMYFDQRSLFTSQIEYTSDQNNRFTTQVRIINMLVDVDGDGDKDILCVHSPKDYAGVARKWYWRENLDGFSFDANYQEVLVPADVLNADALEYQIDTQKAEPSSPVGFINVIVTHQRIVDMNGDGAADLVWQKRIGNDLVLYVSLGGYNESLDRREFGAGSVWLSSPGTVSFLKRTELRRDGGMREYSWDTHDLFDITNDRLPDIVEVTSYDNYTQTLMGVSRNTGSGFPAMHDYQLLYGIGDEISLATGLSHYPAVIRSSVSEAEKATCVLRDLIDLNGDGLLDMAENNPVALRYELIVGAGLWWYFYPATEQSFHFAPGTAGGFDFDNQIYFPNLINEPVWTTMDGAYGGHYGEVRSPTDGQFFDMNGDGIADYVKWTGYAAFDVRINTGNQLVDRMSWSWCSLGCLPFPPDPYLKNGPVDGITASIKFPITGNDGINPAGGYALTQNLDDLNGDGQLELIAIAWRNPNGTFRSTNTPWNIYRAWPTEAVPSSNLFLVTSENGASTEISYKLADGYDYGPTDNSIPFPKWFVSLLRHNDYIEGKVQQSNIYSYEGKYDWLTREFRGFGRVEVEDSEKKVIHYYHQGEFDKSIEYRKETREIAAPNTLRHLIELTNETVSYDAGKRRWVRPTVLTATTYDLGGLYQFATREDYQYLDFADYGLTQNVIYNSGDPEERRDIFEYHFLDDMANEKYLLKLKKKTRQDAALNTLMAETLYYDEMDDCDGTCETLLKGKLCKKVLTRGPGLDPAVTRFAYDSLGRLTETISPDLVRSVVQYWDDTPYISGTFYAVGAQPPYQMWHNVYYSDYHGLTGKAGTVCGPQYINNPAEDKCDTIVYDKYGRPLSLSRSLYHEDGRPYAEETLNAGQMKQHGFHTISSPAGKLQVHMAVYSGDVDLYLRNGSPPDLSTFDCRSWQGGTLDESCEVEGPGNIYVAAHVFSGDPYGRGTYGLYVTKREKDDTLGGDLDAGQWHHYGPFDHAGYDSFRVNMYQLSGDSDVYVRFGSEPTYAEYDCRPFSTVDEFCEISDQTGPLYVSVNGWTAGSYTLEIEWTQSVQSFESHTVEAVSYFDRRNGATPPYLTSTVWPQYYYSAQAEKVELKVFAGFARSWLESGPDALFADFNEDGFVDTADLVMMAESWLQNDVKMMPLGGYISHQQGLGPRETYTYFNAGGRPILEQQFADAAYRKTYFEYDEFDRLETAHQPIFSSVYGYDMAAESFNGDYHTAYDALGRITQITNPHGERVLQVFKGPRVEIFDEIDNQTAYVKNKYNEIISKTQTANAVDLTSTFVHDGAGRVVQATDPDGGLYLYTYNMDGSLAESQTPSQHWFYTYTPEGRVATTTKGDPATAFIHYTYDPIGRLSLREELPDPAAPAIGPPRTYAFTYDGSNAFIGRLTRIESDLYLEDNLKYNESGVLIYRQLTDKTTGDSLFFHKTYSSAGDLIQEHFPRHDVLYQYNKLGQVSALQARAGYSARLDVDSITYAANEKVDSLSGTLSNYSGVLSFSRAFSYDLLDQIIDVYNDVNSHVWWLDHVYLPNGQIAEEYDWGLRNFSHSFTYDTANRLTRAQGYVNLPDGSINNGGAFAFEYHKNSSLSRVQWNSGSTQRVYEYQDVTKHQLLGISGIGAHFDYNTDGQRINQAIGTTETAYVWTPGGSLYSTTVNGNLSVFEYTDKGQRWKASRATDMTWYLDDLELIRKDQSVQRLNVELPGGIRCALHSGGPSPDSCSFMDIHDSVVAVYDTAGDLLEIGEYMPYGEKRVISGDDEFSEFDFAGRIKEQATGLLYYGKRYYDPLARQWLSPDPLRITGTGDITSGINTLQPYVYAAADPVSKMDPDGSDPDYAATAGKMALKSASGGSFNPGRAIVKYTGKQVGGPVGAGMEATVGALSTRGAVRRMMGKEEIKGLGKIIIKGAARVAPNVGKQIGTAIVRGVAGVAAGVSGVGTVTTVGSVMYGELASGSLPPNIKAKMRYEYQMNKFMTGVATAIVNARAACLTNAVYEKQLESWKEAEQYCQGNTNGGSGNGGDKKTASGEGQQQERQDNGDYNQPSGNKSSGQTGQSSGETSAPQEDYSSSYDEAKTGSYSRGK